jgi:hypothetical protein
LNDQATLELLREFEALRADLRRSVINAGAFQTMTQGDLLSTVDQILSRRAAEIQRLGMGAFDDHWALGQESGQRILQFGIAIEAGVGPEGKAYYAPETLAPWPGFTIAPAPFHREALRAFTFDRITAVTAEMLAAIRGQVLLSFVGNLSAYDTMVNITHIVGIRDLPYFRQLGTTGVSAKAENIWRTELMTGLNTAKNDFFMAAGDEFPDLEKVWLATGDDRTRDTHIDAHEQTVPLNDFFIVGGHDAMYPHDPILPIRERARCRCTHIVYQPSWGELTPLIGDLHSQVAAERDRREAA